MSAPRKKIIKFNCFSSITLDSDKKRDKYKTIDDTIQSDKQFFLDYFSKLPYYDELMPKIKKTSRGTNFYRGLIRKGVKHKSVFFQSIINSIKKINEEKKQRVYHPKKTKLIKLYELPKIEELKFKKSQIEKKKKIKILKNEKMSKIINESKSVPVRDSSSTINLSSPPNAKKQLIHSNTMFFDVNFLQGNDNNTLNSLNSNINKGYTAEKNSVNNNKLILSPNTNEISTNYRTNLSNSIFKNFYRNEFDKYNYKSFKRTKSLNNVNLFLNKCQEEIINGKEMEGKFNKYTRKFTKEIQDKLDGNKFIKTRDYKVIEDKKAKNKYVKLEEYNYANIKRKMNKKISTSLAFRNRKELLEILKINENAKAIILHLNEMNKINEKMSKRRIIERKRIDEVNSLCEIGFRKKEFLKKKIDVYNIKHKELNELDKSRDNAFNDFFNINVSKNNYDLKGTLLPKLIALKEEAKNSINVGNY
jgi:hypothetical protein